MTARATTGRVTRRRVRTRANLLDAAFAVFAAKGSGRVLDRGGLRGRRVQPGRLLLQLRQPRRAVLRPLRATGRPDRRAGDRRPRLRRPRPGRIGGVERVTEVLLLDRDWLLVKTGLPGARRPRPRGRPDPCWSTGPRLRRAIADHARQARGHTALPAALATPGKPRTPWSPPATGSPPNCSWTGTPQAPWSGWDSCSPRCSPTARAQ